MNRRQTVFKEVTKNFNKKYIFGAGRLCISFLGYLDYSSSEEYLIDGIIVSDASSNKKCLCGIPVLEYSQISIEKNDLVIIAVINDNDIEDLLKKYGFLNIYHVSSFMPMSDDYRFGYDSYRGYEIKRYYEELKEKKLFCKYIEIETINRCNGECSFCPVNKNNDPRIYKKMDKGVFVSIINQLADIDYGGYLALFSNNEPFIDVRITEFARMAREKLPKAIIYLYTNGTLVSLDIFKEIIKYLDFIQIDNYEPQRGKMENVKEIEQYINRNNLEEKYRYFEISKEAVRTSRGGNSPNSKVSYVTESTCALPFVQMVIRPDGKVSLCCNDALGQNTLGDVTKQSLTDIWFGKKYTHFRELLLAGRFNIEICKFCNSNDKRDIWETSILDNRFTIEEHIYPSEIMKEKKYRYIIGVGDVAKKLYIALQEKGINIDGFINCEVTDWNSEIIDGKKCNSIDCLSSECECYLCINDAHPYLISLLRELKIPIRFVF